MERVEDLLEERKKLMKRGSLLAGEEELMESGT